MGVTETILATVIAGLVIVIVTYLTVQARQRLALTNGIVRLKLLGVLPDRTRLVLRHVRDGKDEVADSGPLLNQDHAFRPILDNHEWIVTVPYRKSIGFQFKCYVEYHDNSKEEVLKFLGAAGFVEVSADEIDPGRLWFLLPNLATCETVDHYTNNGTDKLMNSATGT